MTQFVSIFRLLPSGNLRVSDVARIVDTLRRGGLSILPTETGYMLAAAATNTSAVETAFAVKARPQSNPMHVACSSLEMAERFAEINVTAIRLLGELTPGPITVVVRKNDRLPDRLVTWQGTVGIRIPDCAATLQVISALGEPVTATSLNESGKDAVDLDPKSLSQLNWPKNEVVYVVDGAAVSTHQVPSTLVRVTNGELEILREGPIAEPALRHVAEEMGYLEVAGWT